MYDNFFSGSGGIIAVLGIFAIVLILVVLVFLVLYIIGRWTLFKKAGKNGWEAIIPFYNDWIYVEIAGLSPWWFILVIAITIANIIDIDYLTSIASLASLFGLFVCNYNISKKLHKDVAFAILMTIFPFIMIPLIGLSNNYSWDSNVVVSNNGPFNGSNSSDDNNNNNNTYYNYNEYSSNKIDDDVRYCSNCGNKINKDAKFCNNCGKEI